MGTSHSSLTTYKKATREPSHGEPRALFLLHIKNNYMIEERKAPQDWTTWEDFANCYDLVLFNNCTDLVHKDNTSYFEGVITEWFDNHADTHEEGEECTCEPYQWYAIAVSEHDQKFLNEKFSLDIFYSEILGIYILPVYHYGTAWSHVSLSMNKDSE